MHNPSQRRPFRLLILLEGTNVDGTARQALEFCRVTRTLASPPPVTVSVATFVRSSSERLELPQTELHAAFATVGVKVVPIVEQFRFDPRVLPALRRTVCGISPDIIETNHVKSHFLVRLSGIWRSSGWIAYHHGYTKDAKRTTLYNQLDRWSLQVPSRIVTVCQPFRQQLVARGIPASRILVIHNAISPDWMRPKGDSESSPADGLPEQCRKRTPAEKVVLAIGRLSKEKAFSDLLRAMIEARNLSPDMPIRLLIAGEGPERESLERQIQENQLQDRASLLGYVPDLRPFYRTADAVVISSTSEGEPNVLLEAMAAGVPTIATAVGGIPEMVEDKRSALLVPASDPVAMASALRLLFSDAELCRRLVLNGRGLVGARHSPESRARLLIQTYESVYQCGKGRG